MNAILPVSLFPPTLPSPSEGEGNRKPGVRAGHAQEVP